MDKEPLKKLECKSSMVKLLKYVGIGLIAVIGLYIFSMFIPNSQAPWNTVGEKTDIAMPMMDGDYEDEMMIQEDMAGITKSSLSMPNRGIIPPSGAPSGELYEGERKIVKNTSLNLLVEEIDPVVENIKSITSSYGGFIGSLNISEYKSRSANITVYIPEDKIENAVNQVKDIAITVRSENTSGYDVTEQFIDIDARVNVLKKEEEQYLKILEGATKTEDILKIEQQLSRVRREIESNESRKKTLENQTSLATLSVYLEEEKSVTAIKEGEWRPLTNIKKEFKRFIQGLQGFIDYLVGFFFTLIIAIPYLILYLIVLVVVGYILKLVWRRVKKLIK